MKSLWHFRKNQAFTLVEMLVVIAIIAVLAALLLPALTRGKQRAQRIQCIGNLKEMGIAFQIFAHDHQGRFPMQTPQAEGGSEEYVTAGNNINGPFYFSFRHLQTLANELVVARILICPADRDREPALSFGTLQNTNVSYFVGVYADYNLASSVLAGDRNIASDLNTATTLLRGGYGLHWTSELHFFKGNILFSDAHVEQMNTPHVELAAGTLPGTVITLPTAKPPGTSPGQGPGSGPGTSPDPGPATAGTPSINNNPSGQSAPQRITGPQNAGAQMPVPQSPMPSRNGTSGSQMAMHQSSGSSTTFIETHARETNGDAAIRVAVPIAAPPANDDEQPPLLWLMGAAKSTVTNSSGWLWLLLALLIAAAAYLLSRKKKRPARRR